jgi:uncharacterized protein
MAFDPTYMLLVLLPTMVLTMFAQWKVRSAFARWSQVPNAQGTSAQDTARTIMQATGLENVGIGSVTGMLTDYYDPRDKTIHLSQSSTGSSVAAMAVVAHELGHAEQDKVGSTMLRLRASLVPAANIGSNLGIWLIIGGVLLRLSGLAWLGIVFFGAAVAFTLVTLPVEFDASRRAKKNLRQLNLIAPGDEERGVNAVLDAAALTYVAAAAVAVLQLLYWVSRVSGGRSRN